MLTTIDLFAGCGGMTLGFSDEGFVPVLAVENNFAAAATYAANFGEQHTFYGDIKDLRKASIPKVDVVIGGPPCQGFSNLGSRDIKDPRNQLWREYVRIVLAAKPKVFVIENVDRFMKSSEFSLLLAEADHGSLSEYKLAYGHLNAADFGVSQRRKRTFVIGSRVGEIDLPEPTHSKSGFLSDGSKVELWNGTKERIAQLPPHPETTELPKSSVSFFGKDVPGIFKGLDLHIGRRPTELSLARYDVIPPGGGRFNLNAYPELLPNCWKNKPTGTTDVMGRMQWDVPSHTIRTEFFKPEKGAYLHPQWDDAGVQRVNRPITHLEAALLQDFPESFQWCGSKIEIAKQIGNAVPRRLARALAAKVASQL